MNEKRLSDGGEELVLADAAKAKSAFPRRKKQLPVLLIFIVLASLGAMWRIFGP